MTRLEHIGGHFATLENVSKVEDVDKRTSLLQNYLVRFIGKAP
jgi:hypothetical protein